MALSRSRSILVTLVSSLVLACTSASTGDSKSDKPRDSDEPSDEPGKQASERICPSIAKQPRAMIDLGDAALRKAGSYALEVEADGKRESCVIEVAGVGAAQPSSDEPGSPVQGPTTRDSSTCTLITVGGLQSDGSIRWLATVGTPKQVSVTLRFEGATLASGTVAPSYEPDECGFIEPHVTLTKP